MDSRKKNKTERKTNKQVSAQLFKCKNRTAKWSFNLSVRSCRSKVGERGRISPSLSDRKSQRKQKRRKNLVVGGGRRQRKEKEKKH